MRIDRHEQVRPAPPPPPPPPKPAAPEAPKDGVDLTPERRPFHHAPAREEVASPATPVRFTPAELRQLQMGGASNLFLEDANDGQANCLDRAVDRVRGMSPAERQKAELVLLEDTRPGAEGRTGHVVVRDSDGVVDPMTGARYPDTAAFQRANPHYREAGTVAGEKVQQIFATPPGSPERVRALADVPPALQQMLVADPGPGSGYSPAQANDDAKKLFEAGKDRAGTDEDKIWKVLEGKSKAEVDMIKAAYRETYQRDLAKDMREEMTGMFEKGADLAKVERLLQFSPGEQAQWDFAGAQIPFQHMNNFHQHQHDPEYLARYIGLMKENNTFHLFVHTNLPPPGDKPDPHAPFDAHAVFSGALKAALDKGVLTEAEVRGYAIQSLDKEKWSDLLIEWGRPSPKGIREASAAFDKAKDDVAKLDEELRKHLAGFDHGLTEAQTEAYIKAFRSDPERKKKYEDYEKKANDLARSLEANPDLAFDLAKANPSEAAKIKSALTELSNSSQAKTALDLLGKADRATIEALGGDKAVGEIIEKALPRAMGALVSEGDPETAFKKFVELTAPLKPFFGVQHGLDWFKEGWNGMQAGHYDRLHDVKHAIHSGPMKGLAAAYILIGAAHAKKYGQEGEYLKATRDFAATGRVATDVFAAATAGAADAAKNVRFGEKALDVATFSAKRIAPVLGLVANAAALSVDIKEAQKDGNAGTYIKIFGDAFATLGSLAEIIPGGQPFGLAAIGIGTVISAFGQLVSNQIEKGELADARKEIFDKIGVDEPLRTALATKDKRLEILHKELGLPPEKIQELAKKHPWLLNDDLRFDPHVNGRQVAPVENFSKFLIHSGVTGDKAFELMNRMSPADLQHFALMMHMQDEPAMRDQSWWDGNYAGYRQAFPERVKIFEEVRTR